MMLGNESGSKGVAVKERDKGKEGEECKLQRMGGKRLVKGSKEGKAEDPGRKLRSRKVK